MTHSFHLGGRALEEMFFRKQDAVLMEKQKELERMERNQQTLSEVSGITNKKILKKLVELEIGPHLLATLAVVPLVEVAWADGEIQEEEREAILAAAAKAGFGKGSVDHTLLEKWLIQRPPPKLLEAWAQYIEGLCEVLSEKDRRDLKDSLLKQAWDVADAAGGILGLTFRVSSAEKAILAKMEKAFSHAKGPKE